jgi:hypothetical protein
MSPGRFLSDAVVLEVDGKNHGAFAGVASVDWLLHYKELQLNMYMYLSVKITNKDA